MNEASPPPVQFDFAVDEHAATSGERHKSSYSLLLLFYITTIAAFIAAVCRLALTENDWTTQTIVIGSVIACILCVMIAMLIGYFVGRTWLSTLLGLFVGLVCGVVGLLMTMVSPVHYQNASLLLCAGCWILSLLAIIGNRWKK